MQMQMVKKQQGFTIIELVVVILLLGILAATALPRFLDVTEEAHQAAFEGSLGGFSTGVALYRAQWVGSGQPAAGTAIAEFNNLLVAPGFEEGTSTDNGVNFVAGSLSTTRASGYPMGTTAVTALSLSGPGALTSDRCVEVFAGVLQGGAASLNPASTFNDADVTAFTNSINDVQTSDPADFQVFAVDMPVDTGIAKNPVPDTSGDALNYEDVLPVCVYVYAAEAGNADRSIIYVPWTGALERINSATDLLDRLTDSGVPKVL